MYNYKSDMSYREPYYVVETHQYPRTQTWSEKFQNWRRMRWNGNHQLLPTTDSPTISACTTSTNLSQLEFQSNSTIYSTYNNSGYRKMTTLKENLRNTQPEIEPLQKKLEENKDLQINVSSGDIDICGAEDDSKITDNKAKRQRYLVQIFAAIAVSWVSMVIGYASAYTSPASDSIKRDLHITDNEISLVGGFMPLSALFGGLIGGPLIEIIGRKRTLLLTDLLFLISWTVNFFASNHYYLYVSRMLCGCGVGIASLTLPVYLGETLQPEVRGMLGLLPTAFGNIGILLCYLCGIICDWKILAGIGVLLPIPFFILMWVIPETPRWYIGKGRVEESKVALQWLRGKNTDIDKEFESLIRSQKASDDKPDGIGELLSKSNIKPLLIVLGLMFFQQMSGINAIIFYTTQIFQETGSKLKSETCTTIVGVVNFISTFIATLLIDRLGRKALLYISAVSITTTCAILGTYFYLLKVAHLDIITSYGWIPLASFVIYVLGFSLGFGPVPWLMMGEILPAKIRGPAASISTGFNWSCTSVVTFVFPVLKKVIGEHGVFWLFGTLTLTSIAFIFTFVPETRGQSLEDIERKLAGVKVRRMSSVANLKPMPSTC